MATMLLIDDDPLMCTLLREVLTKRGHEVLIASNGERGIKLFDQHQPAVTVLDLGMPGMNGIGVLTWIRRTAPAASVIVLTGAGLTALEQEARALGVSSILYKSNSLQVLAKTLDELAKQSQSSMSPPS